METSEIEASSYNNDSLRGNNNNDAQTSTPTDAMSQTTMQNRLHLVSVTASEAVALPPSSSLLIDTTSTYNTKFNSTNNTIPKNDNDYKNFSNTSFSVKTTTMKPRMYHVSLRCYHCYYNGLFDY